MGELNSGMKTLLLILNPVAGTRYAAKYLPDILSLFYREGYISLVCVTEKRGDATRFVEQHGWMADRIVCIGGDGTFNETVTGLMRLGEKLPIGYIPAGSTNDFANSLHLSTDVLTAALDAVSCPEIVLDIGRFEDRYFSYVASFGAFTRVSYSTPQPVKNALGHLAYILEGIRDLGSLKPIPVKLVADGMVYEDKYLFGSVSNSTSVGGILKLPDASVDMSDGYFELMLVRQPKTAVELQELLNAVATKQYRCSVIDFFRAKEVEVYADVDMDWSLDGEYEPGKERVTIKNVHEAIRFVAP